MKKIISIILVFLLCVFNISSSSIKTDAYNDNIKISKKKTNKKPKLPMLFPKGSGVKSKVFDNTKKKKENVEKQEKVVNEKYFNIPLIAYSKSMSYMDGRLTTYVNSPAYYWTRQMCSVNNSNGHFMYGDYYAVAMASSFGQCGDKFRVTTNTGNVFKVIKTEQKNESELINSQQHPDGSIIEFVIDTSVASTIYPIENGYVLGGNFNRLKHFNGSIIKIEKEV